MQGNFVLRRRLHALIGFVLGFMVVPVLTTRAWALQATLVADTHVNSARPAANSGSISNLNVGNGYTGLLQFDLSQLPAGTTADLVSLAVLRLYVNRVDTPGSISLQPLSAAWGEYSVTYQTLPSASGPSQVANISRAGGYVSIDVTSDVQSWLATPSANFGLAITADVAAMQFDSKENDLTGHTPTLEIATVTQGTPGATGPGGAQGAAGSPGASGSPGVQGLQGPSGPTGATGASGPEGPNGATGLVGPAGGFGLPGAQGPPGLQGVQGLQGLPGLGFQGTYDAGTTYGLEDVVGFQGSSYISLLTSNQGNMPGTATSAWSLLAAAGVGSVGAGGAPGPAGPSGSNGLPGPSGATGLAGPAGEQGSPGPPTTFLGPWLTTRAYAIGDAVSYAGASYVALQSNVARQPDDSPTSWATLAQAGGLGPAGPIGATGAQGITGVSGSSGPQGSVGPPGLTGPAGVQGVAGAAGPAGAIGDTGAPGMNFRGPWVRSSGYAANDAATYAGATWLAQRINTSIQPDSDSSVWALLASAGSAGPTGVSATVQIGTVATGVPGSSAAVTNSGSSTAAVLNFTIPQGVAGPAGASGAGGSSPGGTPGVPYASMYHEVSFTDVFYSVSSSAGAGTETPSVLTWVPDGCVASRLAVYSQQSSGTLQVTLRSGSTPVGMSDSLLTCTPAGGSTCMSTGSVVIPAGGFVDISILHASGTPAAVWTAVTCN